MHALAGLRTISRTLLQGYVQRTQSTEAQQKSSENDARLGRIFFHIACQHVVG